MARFDYYQNNDNHEQGGHRVLSVVSSSPLLQGDQAHTANIPAEVKEEKQVIPLIRFQEPSTLLTLRKRIFFKQKLSTSNAKDTFFNKMHVLFLAYEAPLKTLSSAEEDLQSDDKHQTTENVTSSAKIAANQKEKSFNFDGVFSCLSLTELARFAGVSRGTNALVKEYRHPERLRIFLERIKDQQSDDGKAIDISDFKFNEPLIPVVSQLYGQIGISDEKRRAMIAAVSKVLRSDQSMLPFTPGKNEGINSSREIASLGNKFSICYWSLVTTILVGASSGIGLSIKAICDDKTACKLGLFLPGIFIVFLTIYLSWKFRTRCILRDDNPNTCWYRIANSAVRRGHQKQKGALLDAADRGRYQALQGVASNPSGR